MNTPEPDLLKTIFTYPWDLHDDGVDRALDLIQRDAALNGVSLAVAYHIATFFLPHNPRRRIFCGDDGVVLFVPDSKYWSKTKLRPRVSHVVENKDWLHRIVDKIKKRGLHFTAWTVYFFNHYLARTYPDAAKRDALGNLYTAQLCPASPEARQYALALTEDLAANYKPDAFYLESLSYLPFSYGFLGSKVLTPMTPRAEFLLGLCFCEHCVRAAGNGMDAQKFKADVAAWLQQQLPRMPGPADMAAVDESWLNTAFDNRLQHFLAARGAVATSLYEEVIRAIRSHGDIRIESDYASAAGFGDSGLVPERANKVTDRLGIGIPSRAEQGSPLRKSVTADKKLIANIQPANIGGEAMIQETVRAARRAGVDGFTFYNYGLIREQQLRWIGAACRKELS